MVFSIIVGIVFGEKIDFQNDYDYMDTDEKMYDLFNSLYDFFEKI